MAQQAAKVAKKRIADGDCAFWAIRAGIRDAWGDQADSMISPPLDANWEFLASPAYIEVRTLLGLPWPKEFEYRKPEAT